MGLFIVDGHNWSHGESSYFCVQAHTKEKADLKVKLKLDAMREEERRTGQTMPCEIKLDENGVSQNLIHVW